MSDRSSSRSSPDAPPRVAAVVVAGGAGLRMGGATGGVRKQYALLLGEPVLARAVRPFLDHPAVTRVVVVLPPDDAADPPRWLLDAGVVVAAGGATRSESVRSGLAALSADTEIVLVHDGARPFVGASLIDRVVEGAADGAVIPGLRATDTLKEVGPDGRVLGTLDRSRIWHAQTPQGFSFPLLVEGHRRAREEGWEATDDASLCERLGASVRVVEGDPENIKITQPVDLEIARALAARRDPDAGVPTHAADEP